MDQLNYSVEDFVLDSDFRKWILSPNNKSNLQWEEYIKGNPQCIENIRLARQIVLNMPGEKFVIDEKQIGSIWDTINKNLVHGEVSAEVKSLPIRPEATIAHFTQKHKAKRRTFNFRLLKVAALFMLAFALGALYYTLTEKEKVQEIKWLTFSTKPGVKSALTLSDGTVVKLNARSSIRYMQNFVGDTREVFLEGEAFFDVAHDTLKPFIVHTKDISTKALGTTFNIHSGTDEKITVSLVSGKVEVRSAEVPEFVDYLTPGEQINTFAKGKSWEKGAFDPDVVMAWLDQTIIFDDTPLPEAIKILEDWFGVTITLNHFKDENLTLSGKFKGETLKNILEGLSYTARFSYEINGKEIQINFQQ